LKRLLQLPAWRVEKRLWPAVFWIDKRSVPRRAAGC